MRSSFGEVCTITCFTSLSLVNAVRSLSFCFMPSHAEGIGSRISTAISGLVQILWCSLTGQHQRSTFCTPIQGATPKSSLVHPRPPTPLPLRLLSYSLSPLITESTERRFDLTELRRLLKVYGSILSLLIEYTKGSSSSRAVY
jgi:hypothetical protein